MSAPLSNNVVYDTFESTYHIKLESESKCIYPTPHDICIINIYMYTTPNLLL